MDNSIERVYLGLGSNLDNPIEQLHSALAELCKHPKLHHYKTSPFYLSKPIGPQDQPDYINAVTAFDCELTAHELLDVLQTIEHQHGRVRTTKRWGARTLDLDLLLYGKRTISTPCLIVPHPELTKRNFVLYPLADLESQLVLPSGEKLSTLLTKCSALGLTKLSESCDTK